MDLSDYLRQVMGIGFILFRYYKSLTEYIKIAEKPKFHVPAGIIQRVFYSSKFPE